MSRYGVIITGGSYGIGFGIARAFVRDGWHVLITGRTEKKLHEAVDELKTLAADGQVITSLVSDAADPAAIDALLANGPGMLPSFNCLVANAGFGSVRPIVETDLETWQAVVDLNLTGVFLAIRNAARHFLAGKTENASIIVVGSIRAVGARPGRSAYAATKAAVNQLVRVAASEWAPNGLRINVLAPGITLTPMAEANPGPFAEAVKSVPMARAGTIDEMGSGALYLASPQSKFVTGTVLTIDGGESLY